MRVLARIAIMLLLFVCVLYESIPPARRWLENLIDKLIDYLYLSS